MRTARLLTISQDALPEGCICLGRVYLLGVYLLGRCTYPGGVPAQVLPPCEQNDRQVQKYYLAPQLRLRAVMNLRHSVNNDTQTYQILMYFSVILNLQVILNHI